MDLGIYLSSFPKAFSSANDWKKNTIGGTITRFSEDVVISDYKIALIGVLEGRGAEEFIDFRKASSKIRAQFYSLYNHFPNVKMIDLGDVLPGSEVSDTYFALTSIVEELVKKEVIPIVLGGSQDLTFASYTAYEALEQSVNIVTVDPKIDIGVVNEGVSDNNYINHILMHQPNYLFNYSSLGYQSYLTDDELISLMEKLNFDAYRLGVVKNDLEEVEPIVRNADILSFDMAAIKASESPASMEASPNGFDGEDACRIARYAGLSDKLSSFAVYNYVSEKDVDDVSAKLIGQMLWYFIDGFNNRLNDYPVATKGSYTKYHVAVESEKLDLSFYKSPKSGRWWIEVPYPQNGNSRHERHLMMPCSYSDYLKACEGKIPERWWQAYQKLM